MEKQEKSYSIELTTDDGLYGIDSDGTEDTNAGWGAGYGIGYDSGYGADVALAVAIDSNVAADLQ